MNPMFYIHAFAVIAIVALCLQIFSSFWVPLSVGAAATILLAFLFKK